jgi:hypothetical protein
VHVVHSVGVRVERVGVRVKHNVDVCMSIGNSLEVCSSSGHTRR